MPKPDTRNPANTATTPPPTPALWQSYQGESNAKLSFDFDFVYVMHTADGPVLFTESATLAEFLGWPKVKALTKPGKPGIEGYGSKEARALVLGVRSRWHDPEDGRIFTVQREHEGQKSRRQMLAILLDKDGDGLPVTLSAKSTASGRLFEALTLCNKASTRAKATPGGPANLPPTFMWRLKLTAFSEEKSKDGNTWASREIVPDYDGTRGDLNGLCVTPEQLAQAAHLWSSVGKLWLDAWGEPAHEPEPTERGEAPADDAALERPELSDREARRAAHREAAAEADARDEAEARRARDLNDLHAEGAL